MKVVHADLELWLTRWVRATLPALTSLEVEWVGNTERPLSAGGPPEGDVVHVVVRDDSGPRRDIVLKDASVGITMLAASTRMLAPVRAAMEQLVAALEADAPLVEGPVADVQVLSTQTVPTGDDSLRVYSVCDLTLVGNQ